jgi:hypothetical protein
VNKEVCILGGGDGVERPRRLIQIEKQCQVGVCTTIGKTELAFGDAKIMLDEPQNRTKIMPKIVHVACRCIGGHDNQWNTESVLIVALHTVQDRRLLMIVPASPIIPSDDDRGVLPIAERLSIDGVGAGAVADGVDNGSHPRGSATIVVASHVSHGFCRGGLVGFL